jgi:hypothetical protein
MLLRQPLYLVRHNRSTDFKGIAIGGQADSEAMIAVCGIKVPTVATPAVLINVLLENFKYIYLRD